MFSVVKLVSEEHVAGNPQWSTVFLFYIKQISLWQLKMLLQMTNYNLSLISLLNMAIFHSKLLIPFTQRVNHPIYWRVDIGRPINQAGFECVHT
jgi:hypothetical protein